MKKLLAVIMTAAIVLSCLCLQAFAREVYGSAEADQEGMSVGTQVDVGAPDWYLAEKDAIQTFVAETEEPVMNYFSAEVKAAAQDVATFDVDVLEATGFAAVSVEGAEGDAKITFIFNADVEETDVALTMLGVPGENGIDWVALKTVIDDSKYVVTVPAEVAEQMNGETYIAMVASAAGEIKLPETGYTPPSKTVNDMYTADSDDDEDGFAIVVNRTIDTWFETETGKMAAAENVVSYFAEDVRAQIAEKAANAESMVAYEVVTVEADNYSTTMGGKTVSLTFPTAYSADQKIVVALGFTEGETISWYVMDATAEDGGITIDFTVDQLMRMEFEEAMLAVISDPIA